MYFAFHMFFFNKLTTGPALAAATRLTNVRPSRGGRPTRPWLKGRFPEKQIFLILSTASNVDLRTLNGGGALTPTVSRPVSDFNLMAGNARVCEWKKIEVDHLNPGWTLWFQIAPLFRFDRDCAEKSSAVRLFSLTAEGCGAAGV